jgi:hypothetical protein
MTTYFYFQSSYRHSKGIPHEVVYFKGEIIRETEKAVLLKLERNGVVNNNVKDELWMPKAAISPDKSQPDNFEIARWFRFTEGSYACKVYENSVMVES